MLRLMSCWSGWTRPLVAGLLIMVFGAANASAQCFPLTWGTDWMRQGANAEVYESTIWDPDGDGPMHSVVVIGGEFTYAGVAASHIAFWDGLGSNRWQPLGDGLPASVNALTTWDPDGGGPGAPRLIAAYWLTDEQISRVAAWDGVSWEQVGDDFDRAVDCLISWDADGSGPAEARLIVGGAFQHIGAVPARNLAVWDGATWSELAGGVTASATAVSRIGAMELWDPDDNGPEAADLIVTGGFRMAGEVPAICIARWDGSEWHALGGGITEATTAPLSLATWDHDADLSTPRMIIVGGQFSRAGSVAVNNIAGFVNGEWRALGTATWVYDVTDWDPDGDGPMSSTIVAIAPFPGPNGITYYRASRWDGTTWQALDTETTSPVWIYTLAKWNPPGSTSMSPRWLIAGGDTWNSQGSAARFINRWDIESPGWKHFGVDHATSLGRVLTMTPPNLPGVPASQLVAGGSGVDAQNTGFGRWDGSRWHGFGLGPTTPNAVCWWDPDGAGPLQPELVAGGNFSNINGVQVNYIAAWNGTGWHGFGSGMNQFGYVYAVASWDPDGDGPENPQLVAGGRFDTAGGAVAPGIARWDGAQWRQFFPANALVYALINWDPDGPGPLESRLVRGRERRVVSIPDLVSWWDGAEWRPIGTSFGGGRVTTSVRSLGLWDPDGEGPAPRHLIAGGNFEIIDGTPARSIARWDPVAERWGALGGGVDDDVMAICEWDPDGGGPARPQLVIGGEFNVADNESAGHIARWDGRRWRAMPGVQGTGPVMALLSLPSDAGGDAPLWLVVCGSFSYAGGIHSPSIARLRATDYDPQFYDHPASVTTCRYGDAGLRTVAIGRGDFEYGWEWRMAPADSFQTVTAGANAASGGSVQFVAMDAVDEYQLFISGVAPGAVLEFRAQVIGECAGVTSDSALVDVCGVDYTCDNRVDSADFFEFLTRFFALDSAGDFNADGSINSQDFFEFLNGFFQGC